MRGQKEPGGIPLIWENAYGDGKFVVDNFGFYEKAFRGFLLHPIVFLQMWGYIR